MVQPMFKKYASLSLNEEELSKLLFYTPEHETGLRWMMQEAGRNKFNW